MKHPGRAGKAWDADRLYAYGLRLLAVRARSEHELRQRFQDHAAPGAEVDAAVERLRAASLIDDTDFARSWVESRRRASPRGTRLLRSELIGKGVERQTIEAVLGEPDEPDLAFRAGQKKARALINETPEAFTRKLSSFLARRGFDYEVVGAVVGLLLAERDKTET